MRLTVDVDNNRWLRKAFSLAYKMIDELALLYGYLQNETELLMKTLVKLRASA